MASIIFCIAYSLNELFYYVFVYHQKWNEASDIKILCLFKMILENL